jgi:hypothetical protein
MHGLCCRCQERQRPQPPTPQLTVPVDHPSGLARKFAHVWGGRASGESGREFDAGAGRSRIVRSERLRHRNATLASRAKEEPPTESSGARMSTYGSAKICGSRLPPNATGEVGRRQLRSNNSWMQLPTLFDCSVRSAGLAPRDTPHHPGERTRPLGCVYPCHLMPPSEWLARPGPRQEPRHPGRGRSPGRGSPTATPSAALGRRGWRRCRRSSRTRWW